LKQILQNLKSGKTEVVELPDPLVRPGSLLIQTTATFISAGTEKMLVEFGKANYIEKARSQPDRVKQVFDKIITDGLIPTIESVTSKMDQPLALGYCNVGKVAKIGEDVEGFNVGDRVVSNGPHASVVCIAKNLCVKVPNAVDDETASFTVLGSIALQGIRLLNVTLGETIVVIGLGLIGLAAVQLLRAQGCRVLGVDFDTDRCDLACKFGAETVNLGHNEDLFFVANKFSRNRGIDGVLITASTKSNEPVFQAAQICRKRGRIVLVGVVGLELSRADFYEKELSFQVSCSYGPGRYDVDYEEKGHDYPIGFVRWTEQRNFEAVLDSMASGTLDVKTLITHRFMIENADEAYTLLTGESPYLGIVINYPNQKKEPIHTVVLNTQRKINKSLKGSFAFIGAGNYASRTLIPAFKNAGVYLHTILSSGGVSGTHFGKKFHFEQTSTDISSIIGNSDIDTIVIATRHNTHAELVCLSLLAGKNVFVEKPIALTLEELRKIENIYNSLGETKPLVMVGFNRRFAPQIQKMQKLLSNCVNPKCFIITVNAGEIPLKHWTQDRTIGGGRIIGEVCHFIDLMRFLAKSPIVETQVISLSGIDGISCGDDKVSITLTFKDGSFGSIHYFANGHKSFPKERIEVFCDGRILQLDNFRKMTGFGWPNFSKMNLWSQDKGQNNCAASVLNAIQNGLEAPINFSEIIEVSRATIEVAKKASEGMKRFKDIGGSC